MIQYDTVAKWKIVAVWKDLFEEKLIIHIIFRLNYYTIYML